MKLLYYSSASYGGIADYAHEQANALVKLGVEITFLCSHQYPTGRGEKYHIVPILKENKPPIAINNKLLKKINFANITCSNFTKLANYIEEHKFQYVLLGSYIEYLAPLWSNRLQKLAEAGVVFGAIVHDPVRDFVVGPEWWHRWSIACGYSFLREVFVHEKIELDTGKFFPQLRTNIIPFGIYSFPKANKSKEEMLRSFDIPSNAKVMLAFGHIRDNKNLDLVIQAIRDFNDIYLIIAGKEQSANQKNAAFYKDLAKNVGVFDRCRWEIRFVSDIDVANLFEITDLMVLTYSKTFHSASSALSAAANYYKPCIASGGESSLRSVVQLYQLGVWVEPDNLDAIKNGIIKWLDNPPNPQWERYIKDNSWEINAQLVIDSFSN
jgi:glycosyltransferase involved in cell wall biosynthesis